MTIAFALAFSASACAQDEGACRIARTRCPTGQTACGQQCKDVLTDPANCGGCGIPCSTGQVCGDGACICAPGGLSCADAPPIGVVTTTLVTSGPGAYWDTTGQATEISANKVDVTVDETSRAQTWEGFGGAFNELGWRYLSLLSQADRDAALRLLYGDDGARFVFGRIPIGASDYASDRYTLEEAPDDGVPPAFSLDRDRQALLPFVKAAQAIKANIRFWASPWTPPTWMKQGPFQAGSVLSSFDGGTMSSDDVTLGAFAAYLRQFVQAYAEEGIAIEAVSAQNEPSYSGNYPTCLWTPTTYAAFIGRHLGPTLRAAGLGTKILLGTFNGGGADSAIVSSVMGDAAASPYVSAFGFQWGMIASIPGVKAYDLPVWQTEHKAGNYPWLKPFNPTAAPNDHAFAVESWGLIRDWIRAGVTAYSAWNMVLDTTGVGIDTTRVWPQDALLTVDTAARTLNVTPTYWVFRHVSRFVATGAKVIGVSGGDALAFRNPDGSIVAVIYNAGVTKTETLSAARRTFRFEILGSGWATLVVPSSSLSLADVR